AGSNDHFEAIVGQGPRRVLARGAATKVLAGQKDARFLMVRMIEHKILLGAPILIKTPVVKEKLAESGSLDAFEGLFRSDLVGVDVGADEGIDETGVFSEWLHYLNSQCRTSVKCPVTAAAAAIAGLTRCVRPPRPWRASKLRLLVDAQR